MGSTEGREPTDTLRGLTATGPSKVGVDKAMRARDVSRPHAEDTAEQEPEAQSAGGSGSAGSSPDSS